MAISGFNNREAHNLTKPSIRMLTPPRSIIAYCDKGWAGEEKKRI